MSKILSYILPCLFIICVGCTQHPTGDVKKDSEYLTSQIIDLTTSGDTTKLNNVCEEYAAFYNGKKASKLEFYGRILQMLGGSINPAYKSDNSDLNKKISEFNVPQNTTSYFTNLGVKIGKQYMLTFISDNFTGSGQYDANTANNFIPYAQSIFAMDDLINIYVDKYKNLPPEEVYTFCNMINATQYFQQYQNLIDIYMQAHQALITKYEAGQLDPYRYPDLYRVIGNVADMQRHFQDAARNYTPPSFDL